MVNLNLGAIPAFRLYLFLPCYFPKQKKGYHCNQG